MMFITFMNRNTGVNIDTINLVWTFGFFGYMIGSLGTSFIFKRYLRRPAAKLCFLWLTIFLTGVTLRMKHLYIFSPKCQAIMIVLPLTSSFAVLVTARLLQILSLGAFCTADAGLIVYMLGPEKSR